MKLLFSSILLFCLVVNCFGQKQFSTKQEALKYLNDVFSKNFVKTYVDRVGMENYAMFSFDYQITEKFILIIFKRKGIKKGLDFTLLPFDKIHSLRSDNDHPIYKTTSSLLINSNCRCFKFSDFVKEFGGEDKFDELKNSVYFPFNLNDEKYILESMQNAFNILSGTDG